MASSGTNAIAAAAVAIVVLTTPYAASAITCGAAASAVAPCMVYARSGQDLPSAAYCEGVQSVSKKAATSADRQVVCNCLKSLIKSVSINYSFHAGAVAGLPSKCGVNAPFAIGTSTDCSKSRRVH